MLDRRSTQVGLIVMICLTNSCVPQIPIPFIIENSVSQEEIANSRNFSTINNKSILYIYRMHGDLSDRRTLITIDSINIGFGVAGHFFKILLDPGKHDINLQLESLYGLSPWQKYHSDPKHVKFIPIKAISSLAINCLPGNIYFVKSEIRTFSNWGDGSFELKLMNELIGKDDILHSRYGLQSIQHEFPELK